MLFCFRYILALKSPKILTLERHKTVVIPKKTLRIRKLYRRNKIATRTKRRKSETATQKAPQHESAVALHTVVVQMEGELGILKDPSPPFLRFAKRTTTEYLYGFALEPRGIKWPCSPTLIVGCQRPFCRTARVLHMGRRQLNRHARWHWILDIRVLAVNLNIARGIWNGGIGDLP